MNFPPLSPQQQVWRNLLYGQRSLMLRLTTELKQEFDLTAAQYEALLTLWEAPHHRLRASTLAQHLLYSSGSASHLVSSLEKRGLVVRGGTPEDARVVEVWLTAFGLSCIAAATQKHIESIDREFSPLLSDEHLPAVHAFARSLAEAEGVAVEPSETGEISSE